MLPRKYQKLTLQIKGFGYTHMMDFPNSDFLISAFTSANFFKGLHHLTTVKLHLYHSHATGKMHVYAHDFRDLKFRENQNFFSCLAHNFFGFDFYFVLTGIRLPIWKTKELNIGGCNLTNINFDNLGNQIKFIDTVKYYQQTLANFSAKATDEEKTTIKN